ncbi:G1/S-specific cyclin-E isoform X2 [Anopheles coustani]|uniref:G1/S-specific cyclin-E isoform X2 n=1 Tax=Anopheles coustani TaxID=139045 RepID=UPI002659FBDC|nr:G1/S-specific cyclin-E isoform X2 [Anopheles coustani]
MDHSNGSNYASRVPSSQTNRPAHRRGRKRKHTSDGIVETENVQPQAKRLSTARIRRSVHDGASTSSAVAVPAVSAPPSSTPAIGLSMPSIPSSGGSSLGGHSQPAAHSDYTSDTQSSSDCFSNAVEFDLYQLVSPASVSSSNVPSPACDATGVNPTDHHHHQYLHHVPHHQQRHPPPSWLPKGDTTPHGGNRKVVAESLDEKPTNCGGLVESCYWMPSYKQRSCPMPSLSWVDTNEMFKKMCRKDDVGWLAREPNMFNDHPGLQPRMRAILLDWLNEVCEVYKMYRETYYLAVDYIDRYLSRKKGLMKTHLQLLGVTALFIAAKVEEIYPPKLRDFAYVTDGACTEEDILREELLLLCELEWNINPLTVIGWLGMYMQINVTSREPENQHRPAVRAAGVSTDDTFVYPQFSAMEFAHTAQLIDLCSLDVGMANFKYSVIAAAAISHTFDKKTATLVSGMHWEEIAPCAKWMEPFFQVICEENATYPLTFLEQNEQIKISHGLHHISPKLLTDLYYNKQTHTTSLEMLDMVFIKMEEMESTARVVQLEASPAPLGIIEPDSGILTPPASNRKSLEMVLITAAAGGTAGVEGGGGGGGGSSCDGQQHPAQRQHNKDQEPQQLQPPPGLGVIVKEIALK